MDTRTQHKVRCFSGSPEAMSPVQFERHSCWRRRSRRHSHKNCLLPAFPSSTEKQPEQMNSYDEPTNIPFHGATQQRRAQQDCKPSFPQVTVFASVTSCTLPRSAVDFSYCNESSQPVSSRVNRDVLRKLELRIDQGGTSIGVKTKSLLRRRPTKAEQASVSKRNRCSEEDPQMLEMQVLELPCQIERR